MASVDLWCRECNRPTVVILDHSSGDTICTECGLVLEEGYIDDGSHQLTQPSTSNNWRLDLSYRLYPSKVYHALALCFRSTIIGISYKGAEFLIWQLQETGARHDLLSSKRKLISLMKSALTNKKAEEADLSDVIETVNQHVKDAKMPDVEVVCSLWEVLMDFVQWSANEQQQNANSALCQVKTWGKLLNAFCTSGKLELELMYEIQIQCCKDVKLMKHFPDIIRSLHDQDVLAEDTILHWFSKGTNSHGRKTFVKALEPYVKWLEAE